MNSRIVAHTVLATACAAAVLTPLSTPAHGSYVADTTRHRRISLDARFDVLQPSEQNGAEEDYVPAAGRTLGDITVFEVDHRRHRVRFRISAQELVRPAVDDTYEAVIAGVSVRTPDGTFYAYVGLSNFDTRTRVLVGRTDHEPQRCAGKAASFDEESDTVTISVPRHCLGIPSWVQASASVAYSWPGGGDGDFYVDVVPQQSIAGPPRFTRRAWHPHA